MAVKLLSDYIKHDTRRTVSFMLVRTGRDRVLLCQQLLHENWRILKNLETTANQFPSHTQTATETQHTTHTDYVLLYYPLCLTWSIQYNLPSFLLPTKKYHIQQCVTQMCSKVSCSCTSRRDKQKLKQANICQAQQMQNIPNSNKYIKIKQMDCQDSSYTYDTVTCMFLV